MSDDKHERITCPVCGFANLPGPFSGYTTINGYVVSLLMCKRCEQTFVVSDVGGELLVLGVYIFRRTPSFQPIGAVYDRWRLAVVDA